MNDIEKFFEKENFLKGDIGNVLYINEDGKAYIDIFYISTVNQIQYGGIEDANVFITVPYTKEWGFVLNELSRLSPKKYCMDIKLFNIHTIFGDFAIEVSKGNVRIGTFADWRVREGKRVIG